MVGNIVGEPINKDILKQIDLRQKMHGSGYNSSSINRSPEVLNYLNNRNAWIKMASGSSLDGEDGKQRLQALQNISSKYLSTSDLSDLMGKGLATKSVLFNTIQASKRTSEGKNDGYIKRSGVRRDNLFANSQDKMYGGLGSNSRGLQPVGGITDISIKYLNRGSIRKATVNIKVYNKFQFSIIETLYLKLGYIMMLEWGWDKYIDSIDTSTTPPNVTVKDTQSSIIENSWFSNESFTQRQILSQIDFYKNKYKGNYGGFMGKVSNFSWTLNKDNSYDITIDLLTLGSIIESLKANITAEITEAERTNLQTTLAEKFDVKKEDGKYGMGIIDNIGSNTITQWIGSTIADFPEGNKNYLYAPNLAGPFKPSQRKDFGTNKLRSNIPTNSLYYVRFKTLLDKLQTLIIGEYVNNNAKGELLGIESSIDTTLCNYAPNLIPLDPYKCVFSIYFDDLLLGSTLNKTTFNKPMFPFVVKEGDSELIYGKLMNVYLNFDFISNELESNLDEENNISVFQFLESICKGINDSTGNTTNIEVAIKDDKTIYFLEKNPIKGFDNQRKETTPYPLEIYGYNPDGTSSFVKDFQFQTKITPKLMSMITVAKTSEGSSTKDIDSIPYQNWNKGVSDRFETKLTNQDTKSDGKDTKESDNSKKIKAALLSDLKNDVIDYDSWFQTNNYDWVYEGIKYDNLIPPGGGLKGPSEDQDNEALFEEAVRRVEKYQAKVKEEENKTGRKIVAPGTSIDSLGGYINHVISAFGGDTGTSQYKTGADDRVVYNFVKKIQVYQSNGKWWLGNNDSDFVKKGISYWKNYLRNINLLEFKQQNVNSSLSGFIPVEVNLTTEGIDGIKIYNELLINQRFLPSSYPQALKFLIKGVDHKISNNIWETSISTIATTPTNNIPSQVVKNTGTTTNAIQNQAANQANTTDQGIVSSYPELPIIDPPPVPNLLPYQEAVQILTSITNSSTSKAVFAVLFAEASKSGQAFSSAGGFNYAGVQTDVRNNGKAIRWGGGSSNFIKARYVRRDAERKREFAVFENNTEFLKFMVSRITAKGFNGSNGDSWTTTYINKWWSPPSKAKYVKGTTKYNQKLSIYNSSQTRYNEYA